MVKRAVGQIVVPEGLRSSKRALRKVVLPHVGSNRTLNAAATVMSDRGVVLTLSVGESMRYIADRIVATQSCRTILKNRISCCTSAHSHLPSAVRESKLLSTFLLLAL